LKIENYVLTPHLSPHLSPGPSPHLTPGPSPRRGEKDKRGEKARGRGKEDGGVGVIFNFQFSIFNFQSPIRN
jgi:hypothetical protein